MFLSPSGPWSGPRPSPRSATSPTSGCAGPSSLIPEIAAEFAGTFGRDSRRPGPTLPARRRRDRRGRARLGARHRSRTPSTSCAAEGERIGVLGITALPAVPRATRSGRLCAGASRVVVLERALAPGTGGIVAADVRAALAGRGRPRAHRDRRARRPADHHGRRCAPCSHAAAGRRAAGPAELPRPRHRPGRPRTGPVRAAPRGPAQRREPAPRPRRTGSRIG